MYRINLYPEYRQARERQRRQARATAVLTVLLGVELLLAGALVLGDVMLRERIASLRDELPALTVNLEQGTNPCPQYELARQMADVLTSRVIWAPKLAALADRSGAGLDLSSVTGKHSQRGQPASLTIAGTCDKQGDLTTVNSYVEALRSDQRVRDDLPTVALGTLHGDRQAEFEVQCRSGEVK